MKRLFFIGMLMMALVSCKNSQNQNAENKEQFESFVVMETMEAGGYSYILGENNGETKWYAIAAQEVKIGDVFYFANPLVMVDFHSKELDRPFDEISFLMEVSKNPDDLVKSEIELSGMPSGKIITDQLELSLKIPKGAISIAELYENKQKYVGKAIMVYGQVTKFNPEIMSTNWVHLQDGTSFDGKYDLTLTTLQNITVGDVLTFEGIVTLDKDFGYGYLYEILLEESIVVK